MIVFPLLWMSLVQKEQLLYSQLQSTSSPTTASRYVGWGKHMHVKVSHVAVWFVTYTVVPSHSCYFFVWTPPQSPSPTLPPPIHTHIAKGIHTVFEKWRQFFLSTWRWPRIDLCGKFMMLNYMLAAFPYKSHLPFTGMTPCSLQYDTSGRSRGGSTEPLFEGLPSKIVCANVLCPLCSHWSCTLQLQQFQQ